MNMCVSPSKKINKDIAHIVVRVDESTGFPTPVAVMMDYEQATNLADVYNQEFKDREIDGIHFEVLLTSFYD